MKNKELFISELKEAKEQGVCFVSYGYSDIDIGIGVPIDEAIEDIEGVDGELIGDGYWCACDEHGGELF